MRSMVLLSLCDTNVTPLSHDTHGTFGSLRYRESTLSMVPLVNLVWQKQNYDQPHNIHRLPP